MNLLIFTQIFWSGFVRIHSALSTFSGKTFDKIIGSINIETTNEVIKVKAIVILRGPINAPTVPLTINSIGKNMKTVISVPGIIDHIYFLRAFDVASQNLISLCTLNSHTIHSVITIRLSTIIHKVNTSENETTELNEYPRKLKSINVMKYTRGNAIVTHRDVLTQINKNKIIIIVRPVCRKFETNVPYILSISFDFEYVSNTFIEVFDVFHCSIELCTL
ncbi:MAG: hypothetical protein ACPHY8_00960 [Patescibacteria group bacterium]